MTAPLSCAQVRPSRAVTLSQTEGSSGPPGMTMCSMSQLVLSRFRRVARLSTHVSPKRVLRAARGISSEPWAASPSRAFWTQLFQPKGE